VEQRGRRRDGQRALGRRVRRDRSDHADHQGARQGHLSKRGGGVRTVTDVVPNRFWTATELTAAIRLSGGFAVAARYGDFDADTPVEAPDAWRMILVLRREGPAAEPAPPGAADDGPGAG
jgi:hypothetical protein